MTLPSGVLRFLLISLYISQHKGQAKILRNNALMNKMISDFHKDNNLSEGSPAPRTTRPEGIVSVMQHVLCKNFPTIPCEIITADATLRKLIEKSIQQINYKKLAMDKTTTPAGYSLTLFPVVNSEDLSNFLQVHPIASHYMETANKIEGKSKKKKHTRTNQKRKAAQKAKTRWSNERNSMRKNKNKELQRTTVFNGRKKIRKFYPHKIKYAKNMKNGKDFVGSEENLSMSVENHDSRGNHRSFMPHNKGENEEAVWRIDYMKHGEPSLNRFGREHDQLKTKLMKSSANVMLDDNIVERAARRDILHPDIYIKKNIRNHAVEHASDGVE